MTYAPDAGNFSDNRRSFGVESERSSYLRCRRYTKQESDVTSSKVAEASWLRESFQSGRQLLYGSRSLRADGKSKDIQLYSTSTRLGTSKVTQVFNEKHLYSLFERISFGIYTDKRNMQTSLLGVRVLWNLEDPNSRAGGVSSIMYFTLSVDI